MLFTAKRFPALVLFFLAVVYYPANAQSRTQTAAAEEIFSTIEIGIREGDVAKFSSHFSNQTYLSLAYGYSGYCSSNQSFYILQSYLRQNEPVSFKFTSVNTGGTPYATGVYLYESKNKRGTAQVFISLKESNGILKISQLTIR